MLQGFQVDRESDGVERSIAERFEAIVGQYPDRLAAKSRDRSVSYRELNEAANRIRHALLTENGSRDDPIALLFEHGVDVITGMFGALKAGKLFCVLDAYLPEERIGYVLNDIQAGLILTNSRNFALARRIASDTRAILNIDDLTKSHFIENFELSIFPNAPAYVVYTSGSTGSPRGVLREHRQTVVNAISNGRARELRIQDRLSLVHTVSFGSGEADLYMCLLNGAAVCLFDIKSESIQGLAKWLKDEQITIFHSSPAIFREFTTLNFAANEFSSLRLIRLSGAPITQSDFDRYKNKFSRGTFLEFGMGSTEAGAICAAVVDRNFSFPREGSPVGHARQGKEILILNDNGHQVDPGQIGEIAVKSRGLNPGYWKKPELTASKFLGNPDENTERVYMTGDMGRILPDGMVIHLGRKDLMIKIRGYRVDLTEVERALLSHPMVKNAAVVAWERQPGEKYLAGYVVLHRESTLNVSSLNQFIRTKLPDYMIPSAFMFLPLLPLTNGKLDRKCLPEPDHSRPELSTSYAPPQDEIEQKLVRTWQDVLQVTPIGIDDNFFDLGGHSLLACQLFTRLDDEFHRLLPLSVLLSAPTVRLLAPHYRSLANPEVMRSLVPLRVTGHLAPVFAVPGVYGNVVGLADLCRELGVDRPFYGLQSIGLDGKEKPFDSMEDMARFYVMEIIRVRPSSPIVLVGACFGAGVAWEMTRQMLDAGLNVAFLGLLDPIGLTIDRSSQPRKEYNSAPPKSSALKFFIVDRLSLYWREMRCLETGQRMGFLSDKFQSLARNFVDRKAMRSDRREIYQLAVLDSSKRAGRHYRLKPLEGSIGALEIFTSQHPRNVQIESYPWDTVWKGEVVFHRMPGVDSGDMLSGDNARVLGTTLSQRLRAASTA
jgi:amino acid adenylation domain-containing protein